MKKIYKGVMVAISVIGLVAILLFIFWQLQPSKKLNIYILDKTVTRSNRPEHRALVWVLNQDRIVGPDGKTYRVNEDYWGFFPIDLNQQLFDFKAIRLNEVDAYAAAYDAAYYADCYGVYSFEWYKNDAQPIRSSKVYGGLNQNDYLLLKSMKDMGKLIIGEYNMFSTPTNALMRSKAEELFNVSWTGWSGVFCRNLTPNEAGGPAPWMPKLYESQHLKPWPSEGKGIILLSNDGLVDVLVDGEDINSAFPVIISDNTGISRFGLISEIPFTGWFEFVVPGSNAVTPSTFKINTTQQGLQKLRAIGLTNEFPAVIQAKSNEFTFYFAGDFTENKVTMFTSKMMGGKFLNQLLEGKSENSQFFYKFYSPLMENILNSYINKTQ